MCATNNELYICSSTCSDYTYLNLLSMPIILDNLFPTMPICVFKLLFMEMPRNLKLSTFSMSTIDYNIDYNIRLICFCRVCHV